MCSHVRVASQVCAHLHEGDASNLTRRECFGDESAVGARRCSLIETWKRRARLECCGNHTHRSTFPLTNKPQPIRRGTCPLRWSSSPRVNTHTQAGRRRARLFILPLFVLEKQPEQIFAALCDINGLANWNLWNAQKNAKRHALLYTDMGRKDEPNFICLFFQICESEDLLKNVLNIYHGFQNCLGEGYLSIFCWFSKGNEKW